MPYDSTNVFAKILRKEMACETVYEDDYALAFYDLHPKARIHVLVVPKGPFRDVYDFHQKADADTIVGFHKAINATLRRLGIVPEGFKMIINTGTNGGQEVPHYHVHILGGQRVG